MHIDALVEPPLQYQLREVDLDFVSKMKSLPGIGLGYNKTVFPVIVEGSGVYKQGAGNTFYTLGGNHLRETLQSLHAKKELSTGK